ncbi:MAG: twin-arginine translocase subunit TatC [Rhodothermales bacterium]
MKLFGSRTASKETPAGHVGDGAAGTPPDVDAQAMAEMTFLEHLEELRWALFKGIGGILLTTLICFAFSDFIIEQVLMGPKESDFITFRLLGLEIESFELQNRSVTGQFFAWIGMIMAAGFVLGSPFFVFALWKFIEPGLYPNERKGLRFSAVFATGFFMLGIAFGYFVITPFALKFFAEFELSPEVINEFDITKYASMVTFWSLGAGALFELPVVIYFLSKLGVVTAAMMRKWRKFGLLITLILGSIFTPPDPFTMILVAIPLMGLYELSILISAYSERKRDREMKAALE